MGHHMANKFGRRRSEVAVSHVTRQEVPQSQSTADDEPLLLLLSSSSSSSSSSSLRPVFQIEEKSEDPTPPSVSSPPTSLSDFENQSSSVGRRSATTSMHRRCRSQGNPPISPSSKRCSSSLTSTNTSNESIPGLFQVCTRQARSASVVASSASANRLASRRSCISLASSNSTPYLTTNPKPHRNPSTLIRIPLVRTLPTFPYKLETVIVDRPPALMSNLATDDLYLNGFSLTLDELDELYKVS